MLERKKFIKNYLNEFIPAVISNLISEYDYELIGKCESTLKGHSDTVKCCAILSDGQEFRLISGSHDGTLRAWNMETKECELIFRGHSNWVRCCAILPDKRIVSGSDDKTLKVWNAKTGICEMTLIGHTDYVFCYDILPDGRVISGSADKTLKVWDVSSGKCDISLQTHFWVLNCYGLPDGRIMSMEADNVLIIWDIKTGESKRIMNIVHAIGKCDILSNLQIIRFENNLLKIWDIKTEKYVVTLDVDGGSWKDIHCCTILPDGRIFGCEYSFEKKHRNI